MRTPVFFERNAFRVLRLGAGATYSDVHAGANKIRRAATLGLLKTSIVDRPELGDVDRSDTSVAAAVSRLQHPSERLQDRLFWFHIPSERLDSEKAANLLLQYTNDEEARVIIEHDRILEILATVIPQELDHTSIKLWLRALRDWHTLVTSDVYWLITSSLEERGTFEPVALPSEVNQTKGVAFGLFTDELIATARDALSNKKDSAVKQLLSELRGPDDLGTWAAQVHDNIILPWFTKIENISRKIREERASIKREQGESDSNKTICSSMLRRFRAELQPEVALFTGLTPEDHPLRRRASLEAATILYGIAIDFTWANEFDQSEQLQQEALTFSNDPTFVLKVEQGLQELRKASKHRRMLSEPTPISSAPPLFSLNGVGVTLYGNADYDEDTKSSVATYYFIVLFFPIFPIARYRVIREGSSGPRFIGKVPLRKIDFCHLAAAAAVVCAAFIWGSLGDTRTTPSSPSYNASSYSSGQITRTKLSDLKAKIEAGRAQYSALQSRTKPAIDQLKMYQSSLDSIKGELNSLDARQRAGGYVDAAYYNSRVDQHNQILSEYQRLLTANRADLERMDLLAKEDDNLVAKYNALLRR